MSQYFIGGVANVHLYNGTTLIAKSTTLTDSSIEISDDKVEVRGGIGAKLLGQYFHTSAFKMSLTDTIFDLNYVALNTGSDVNVGGYDYTTETVTLASGGVGTLTGTPIPFLTTYVGWARIQGTTGGYQTVTINNTAKTFNFAGGTAGDVVCIEYPTSATGTNIQVPATIIPSTVHAVMKANLYRAGGSVNDVSTSALVGNVVVDVPRLQLSGSQTISMTATGVSNTPLSGMALAVEDASCNETAIYATIYQNDSAFTWYNALTMLSVNPSVVSLAATETATITTYGVGVGYAPYAVPTSELTYTPADPSIATATNGVITAVAPGTTAIVVSSTENTSLKAIVSVTVTA